MSSEGDDEIGGGREGCKDFITIVTTTSYAPGIICLAQSLLLVGSTSCLVALCRDDIVAASVREESLRYDMCAPSNLIVKVGMGFGMEDESKVGEQNVADEKERPTHGAKGALLHVDAPRRALWRHYSGTAGFVLLDADLIAMQCPDELFDLLTPTVPIHVPTSAPASATATAPVYVPAPTPAFAPASPALHAVASFRLKKNKMAFGTFPSCNFNSGVIAVPYPSMHDARALEALVQSTPKDSDVTEEQLMNTLFRGRWAPLAPKYNVPKRIAHHAPDMFATMLEEDVTFLHYMGAKPWMLEEKSRLGSDWEANREVYVSVLEKFWWKLRLGELVLSSDGPSLCMQLSNDLRDSGIFSEVYAR